METFQIIVWVIVGIGTVLFLSSVLYFNAFYEEDSEDKKENSGCSKFLLSIIIVIVCLMVMGMCQGNGGKWEPRHTQNIKPMQNNVNTFILSPSEAAYIINKV